jgi:2-polyprenyl-3-methyl-5-hydroxy-6-metoxy-1,4-benzoquinol methylase
MDQITVDKLLALNREFYTEFAQAFADSRTVVDPALDSILPYIPRRARILDVGCGNGRLANLLDLRRPETTYMGIDAVSELVETARAQTIDLKNIGAQFHVVDITQPDWVSFVEPSSFDVVICLAVLHHIPSFSLRTRVLRDLAGLLAPGGRILLSTWQFLESARLRRKMVDWAEVGVPAESLEPGDYLLDWQRGGRGLRYCHLVSELEVRQLATSSGLGVRMVFRAGGREGNLSLFAMLDRKRG